MNLRPIRGNENQRRPRETCPPRKRGSGDPLSVQWIPAFAGKTSFTGPGVRPSERLKAGKGKRGIPPGGRRGVAEKMLKIVGTNSMIY